jgi:hypothetical protein
MKQRHVTGFTPLPDIWRGSLTELGVLLREEALADREVASSRERLWKSRSLPNGVVVSAFVGEDGMQLFISQPENIKKLADVARYHAEVDVMAVQLGCQRWTRSAGTGRVTWDGQPGTAALMVKFGPPYNTPVRANPPAQVPPVRKS